MATNPVPTPVTPAPAPAQHDEFTGIYGFFRRHQKKLLYTAGLFTLLTFSVTGPMLAAVDSVFGKAQPMPSIAVGGQRIDLTAEDYQYAQLITRNPFALPPVLPRLEAGEGGQGELIDVLALLRRAAIAEGIDVSMAEVDRAIETLREQSNTTTAAQLAVNRGLSSLAQYRDLVREAMRIGLYVKLQTLALDVSDARVLQQAIADKEKITLRVATFDEKALEERLKAAGGLTDEELRKWLDGKTDADKGRMQAFDTNRVELRFGALLLAEFDPAEWQADALKDFTVGDEQLKKTYETAKDQYFKVEGKDGEWQPFDDQAVKDQTTRLVQAEQVANYLLGKLREQQNEAMKAANEEQRKSSDELFAAQNAVQAAKQKLAEKPDDAAAKEELRQAEEVATAKENARKAADEAVKQQRAAFDFNAAFAKLTEGKKGIAQKAFTGKRNGDELKDLDASGLELGLGQWPLAVQATYLQNQGDLCGVPGRTAKAVVLYQVSDVEVRPLKPWDKLKPLAEGAYYAEKAKGEAEAKKKLMEEALLRLAKAKMPEKVAEIEGKRQAEVDKQLAEWEQKTQAAVQKAEATLQPLAAGTQARAVWQKELDRAKAELARKDEKRQELDAAVQKQLEAEVAEAAKKHYGEVLDAAAAEAGFTVTEVGPHPRELAQRPRFDKNYDPTVVYLFRSHAQLKQGEAIDVQNDATNRRWHAAVCTKVEPLTAADVLRRDFEALRSGYGFASFADQQAFAAYGQAFTREALEKRYEWRAAAGVQTVPTPEPSGTAPK